MQQKYYNENIDKDNSTIYYVMIYLIMQMHLIQIIMPTIIKELKLSKIVYPHLIKKIIIIIVDLIYQY